MKKIGYIVGIDLQHDLSAVLKTDDDVYGYMPVIFDTVLEAYKEVADCLITNLQQFVDGERELEDTTFEAEDEILIIEWSDNDIFSVKTLEGSPLYDVALTTFQKQI